VNLRHLEGLVAINRTGSFSAAAIEISLSQSALTQAIARMEAISHMMFFYRGSTGAVPTRAGALFGQYAARALEQINAAGREYLVGARPQPLSRRATLTQLRALAAVERAGSFRGGARVSRLSEPSIHRSIRDLERSLGQPLLLRVGTGLQATPAARAIARATRLALTEIDAGLEAIASGDAAERRLVIGAMPLVRAGLLPSAAAQLCARAPHVRLQVVEGPYPELLNALLDGELDMLLGALRDPQPHGVIQRRLFDDDLVIAARADHPLARTPGWTADALLAFPWVASAEGTPRRQIWEGMMEAAGIAAPSPRVECSSASAIRGLLLQGDWLAMLSPDQFRIERDLGLLAALGGPLPASTRVIGVTTRADCRPDTVQQSMLDILDMCAGHHSWGEAWKCPTPVQSALLRETIS
jgi:DNA-binding transcriptional LysR family regulator